MTNDTGFGIYVHWPFCLHKCPYCDFNSHLLQKINNEEWKSAYFGAIDQWKTHRNGENLTSIYFGGGTPSTADPDIIAAIIERISKYWEIDNAEITLEANPTSVEAKKFASLAQAGVNRISLGFQAFNDHDLKRLGRMHSVNESLQALDIARKYFQRTNFDIIYARQNQTLDQWKIELNQLLKLNPSHISLYQLTIEQGTRFGDLYNRGSLNGLPNDDLATDMYKYTSEFMNSHGFEHYEVSNFAKPDEQSRHNLIYWKGGDYIGVGPGAHGRVNQKERIATTQALMPNDWLKNPTEFNQEALSSIETAEEYVIMGLRINEGIRFERLDTLNFHLSHQGLVELLELGLIVQDNIGIRTTDSGRLVLNFVIQKLLTE